ncbi:hypothetical protein Tco_0682717 [Tanacetum coccineum]|uniref:Uncharacterized protein n=1 Tax=Tanacetum coccineum TaxID=301880 RepID=A0ABQ4XT20_9ASTR
MIQICPFGRECLFNDDEDVGAKADMTNLDTHILVSPIPTTRIHKDHPVDQIIIDIHATPQTRRMTKSMTEHVIVSTMQQRINHKDFQNCLFACFLSQAEPKRSFCSSSYNRFGPWWIYLMAKGPLVLNGYTGTRKDVDV